MDDPKRCAHRPRGRADLWPGSEGVRGVEGLLRFEFRVESRGGTRRSPTKKLALLKEKKEYHDNAFDELISECN